AGPGRAPGGDQRAAAQAAQDRASRLAQELRLRGEQVAHALLRLEGIRKTFNPGQPNEKVALERIDLALELGAFAVVSGSNGAGKSTLLNVVAGDVSPDAGRVLIDGDDVTALPTHLRARFIGRVFQDTG